MTLVANAKVEALLAAALQQQGYQSIILLSGRNQAIESVFKAIGKVQFIFLDQLTTQAERDSGFDDAQEFDNLKIKNKVFAHKFII